METLPIETKLHTALYLALPDLLNLCSVNREYSELCNSDYFWKRKGRYDFKIDTIKNREDYIKQYWYEKGLSDFRVETIKSQDDYNRFKTVMLKPLADNKGRFVTFTKRLIEWIKNGNRDVKTFLLFFKYILPLDIKLFYTVIEENAHPIFLSIIQNHATTHFSSIEISQALTLAIVNNNINVIDWLVDDEDFLIPVSYKNHFLPACRHSSVDIVVSLIQVMQEDPLDEDEEALYEAIRYNNLPIVEYFIERYEIPVAVEMVEFAMDNSDGKVVEYLKSISTGKSYKELYPEESNDDEGGTDDE